MKQAVSQDPVCYCLPVVARRRAGRAVPVTPSFSLDSRTNTVFVGSAKAMPSRSKALRISRLTACRPALRQAALQKDPGDQHRRQNDRGEDGGEAPGSDGVAVDLAIQHFRHEAFTVARMEHSGSLFASVTRRGPIS
jgi:hypothetical protein